MLTVVPYEESEHRWIMEQWLVARTGSRNPDKWSSEMGLMVLDHDGEPCMGVYCWLPLTGGRMFIDGLIGRPNLDPMLAIEAGSALISAVEEYARERDYTYVSTTIDDERIAMLLSKHGWLYAKRPAHLSMLIIPAGRP